MLLKIYLIISPFYTKKNKKYIKWFEKSGGLLKWMTSSLL